MQADFRGDGSGPSGVYVVPRPGEAGVRVAAGTFAAPHDSRSGSLGLAWAANGTTLVRETQGGPFALVRLPAMP